MCEYCFSLNFAQALDDGDEEILSFPDIDVIITFVQIFYRYSVKEHLQKKRTTTPDEKRGKKTQQKEKIKKNKRNYDLNFFVFGWFVERGRFIQNKREREKRKKDRVAYKRKKKEISFG